LLTEDEWRTDLKGTQGMIALERMVVTDPIVHAVFLALTLPLTSVGYEVTPASDTPRDREIAEFVWGQLDNMRDASWRQFVDEAYDFLIFGFYPFEEVWKIEDSRVRLERLSPRPPKTICDFLSDEDGHGRLAALRQLVQGDQFTASGHLVDIPLDKLTLFARMQRGGNPRGRSVFRAAYKPWFIKKQLEVIAAIAIEKRAMGVDVAELTPGADGQVSDTRKSEAESALMGLHVRESQFLVEPPGFKYRVESLTGKAIDPVPFIKMLDTNIARSVMAEFIMMGDGSTGSFSMHRDKSSFFTQALKGHAGVFTEGMTRSVISRIVAFNYPNVPQEEYPWLSHSRLDTRDIAKLAQAVGTLVGAGAITPDSEIEDALRTVLEFPERKKAETATNARESRYPREGRLGEMDKLVDVDGQNRSIEKARDDIVRRVKRVQTRQVRSLVAQAQDAFKKGTLGQALRPDVIGEEEIAEQTAEILMRLYREGRSAVEKETKLQGVALAVRPPNPQKQKEIERFIKLRARALASIMSDKLRSGYTFGVLGAARAGALDVRQLTTDLAGLSEREVVKSAALSASEALQFGRRAEQLDLMDANLVESFTYSAIGDEGTCGPCLEAESRGENVEPGSALFDELQPPYALCEGRDKCRCDFIARLRGEASPGS
jgi:hypothetical protein